MPARFLRRSLFLPALALIMAIPFTPGEAVAQTYICPGGPGPGEVQIGVQNDPGFNGVAVCASDGSSDYGEITADELAASYSPGPDPMARELEAAIAIAYLAAKGQIETHQLEGSTRYKRFVSGGWEYFQDAAAAKPGELCTAFFTKSDSFVAVTTPGGDSPNAYLTFWGSGIPKPKDVKRVKVSLLQTGDSAAQTVAAFNTFNPASGLGGITMAVPDVKALLDNMLDVHAFTVTLGGKTVASVEWTGGIAARDKLKRCVSRGSF